MTVPVTTLDQRFSDPDAIATGWDETRGVLETAELSWIATVRADGRPHVTPLVAVWLDDALHFCTGIGEQKAVNLSGNPHVVLTTGCSRWDQGLDVVVEGEAVRVTDQDALRRLAEAWTAKWDGQWQYRVGDGCFHHPGAPEDPEPILVFSVRPSKILAFAKGAFSHTCTSSDRGACGRHVAARHQGAFGTPFESGRQAGAIDALFLQAPAQVSTTIPRLESVQLGAHYLLATQSAALASVFIYDSGLEALPIGGLTGTIPSPTLRQVQADVRDGQFHLVRPPRAPIRGCDGSPRTAGTSDAPPRRCAATSACLAVLADRARPGGACSWSPGSRHGRSPARYSGTLSPCRD